MTDKRICLSTCGSAEKAAALARELVGRRLAACVNVIPQVRSFYRWEGEVQDDPEHLLVIKTTAEGVDSLRAALLDLHSYDTPELVVLHIEDGSAAYLDWIGESVASRGDSR